MRQEGIRRVRVMVARDGSVVNVTRVDERGVIRSIIWQRQVSIDEGPFQLIFEPEDELERQFDLWLREVQAVRRAGAECGCARRFAGWLSGLRPARPATNP